MFRIVGSIVWMVIVAALAVATAVVFVLVLPPLELLEQWPEPSRYAVIMILASIGIMFLFWLLILKFTIQNYRRNIKEWREEKAQEEEWRREREQRKRERDEADQRWNALMEEMRKADLVHKFEHSQAADFHRAMLTVYIEWFRPNANANIDMMLGALQEMKRIYQLLEHADWFTKEGNAAADIEKAEAMCSAYTRFRRRPKGDNNKLH